MRLTSAAAVIELIDTFYDRQIARGAVRMLPGYVEPLVEPWADLTAEAA
jgi:hypothetical protein